MAYRKRFEGTAAECGMCRPALALYELCRAVSDKAHTCTRERWHRGAHVACGKTVHRTDTWGQDDERS